jgi:hypothetical protein
VVPGGRPEGDLGAVEPLRLPDAVVRAWRTSATWFRARPLLVQLFIGLAALDLVARAVGVVGPTLVLDPGAPFDIVTGILPHNLLILLPALIVIRHPGAPVTSPNLVDGAILVALAELIAHPSTGLASEVGGIGPWAIVAVAVIVIGAIGWIAIGRGLANLNPLDPNPSTAGWANLAAFAIVAAVGAAAAAYLVGPGFDVGDAELNRLITLHAVVQLLAPLTLAYVGRAVIRGLDDRTRPEIALRLGASAMFLAAGLGLAVSLVGLLASIDIAFAQSVAQVAGWGALYWLATGGAISLLVVAFGLGLADTTAQADHEGVTLEPQ